MKKQILIEIPINFDTVQLKTQNPIHQVKFSEKLLIDKTGFGIWNF